MSLKINQQHNLEDLFNKFAVGPLKKPIEKKDSLDKSISKKDPSRDAKKDK